MLKIKKNDEVIIIKGKDRKKRGHVMLVLIKENKVVVGGLNMYKRHLKRKSEKEQSQIISMEKPVAMGNVMLICPHCNLPTRVGFDLKSDKKTRICKKCRKNI